jgi:hypothetical protein
VNGADPLFAKSLLEEARVVGLTPVTVVQRVDELDATFAKLATETDALVFQASFPSAHMAKLGLKYRLPTATALRAYAEIGGFMAYQADTRLLFRRAATFVHKILRGESPADMPVEQPIRIGHQPPHGANNRRVGPEVVPASRRRGDRMRRREFIAGLPPLSREGEVSFSACALVRSERHVPNGCPTRQRLS